MNGAPVPEAGDIVWIDFGPPAGHEQAGRRPALVLSGRDYNANSSVIVVCPISRSPRPWPYKVPITTADGLTGYVLCDQLRAIDTAFRVLRRRGAAPPEVLAEVRARLAPLLGIVA